MGRRGRGRGRKEGKERIKGRDQRCTNAVPCEPTMCHSPVSSFHSAWDSSSS